MATDKLAKMQAERHKYDRDSQAFIDSLVSLQEETSALEAMKRSAGWKALERKLREELHTRILEMVKDDPVIKTLIALLSVTNTKKAYRNLEAAIDEAVPE